MLPRLIVHGGAWNIPDKLVSRHLQGVESAAKQVYPRLLKGLSALDAVQECVKYLEGDPTFDAGRGAFLNAAGEIELDAMIMDGTTLDFGAVAALKNILHPVELARLVMEKTEHCLLVGIGAQQFAAKMGIATVEPQTLLTSRELAYYNKIRRDPNFTTKLPFESGPADTVGAVALDKKGHFAAATSTGGTPRKLPGRVGDSPIVGAGAYADNQSGAASATGWGEAILRVLLSKAVCDRLIDFPARQACVQCIEVLMQRTEGYAGIIAIDREGSYGIAHNTRRMAFAYVEESGEVIPKIVGKHFDKYSQIYYE